MSDRRVPVTVVIATLNEGRRIRAAVRSVLWADEVLVADAGSTDGTAEAARSLGATVLLVPGTTIGQQRNAAIALARNEWVLVLDADEAATPELRQALEALCRGEIAPRTAFRIRSRNWHLGRELLHGPWGHDWKVRVFAKTERFTAARVHENLESITDVGALDGPILHRPYDDLSHQLVKIARYSHWAALDMKARGRRVALTDLTVRPAWRFVRDYVGMSGWRDGRAGFIVAVASAFAVFCKYASLWALDPQMPRIVERTATTIPVG
jgi:glycosyltransferase involved in cell wall biosynthesis